MKTCRACKKELDLIHFSKNKYNPDKLEKKCKKCLKIQREKRKLEAAKAAKVVIPDKKECSICKTELPSKEFEKKKESKDGLFDECKTCKDKERLKRKQENLFKRLPPNKIKFCNGCNRFKPKKAFFDYDEDCKKCEFKRFKQWQKENPGKVKKHAYANRVRIYNKQHKLTGNIKNRVVQAIKKRKTPKFHNNFELIGCSPKFLLSWLEYQFNSKMNWDNYNKFWQISQIVPCSYFNLRSREEQLLCFNWRNCRPVEITKKDEMLQPFQIVLQEMLADYYEQHFQIAGKS